MTSKISLNTWKKDKKELLAPLDTETKKLVLMCKGEEPKAYNFFMNKGFIPKVCRICKEDLKNFKPRSICDKSSCISFAKGSSMRGKLRPEHSARMKKIIPKLIAEGKFWGKEHRKNNKKHMDSLNKTIDRAEHSKKLKSDDGKKRRLLNFINGESNSIPKRLLKNSQLSSVTSEKVNDANNTQIRSWVTSLDSLKTLSAMSRTPSMGGSSTSHYKRIRIKGIKNYWESKRTSITVRSYLEYTFVQWLMSKTYISWRYEWVNVPTEFGFTKPDFKIHPPKSKPWVIEAKGTFVHWRGLKVNPLKNILSVIAFCRNKGYRYTVLNTKHIKTPKPSEWVDLTSLTDFQVISYLVKNIPGALNVLINRAFR